MERRTNSPRPGPRALAALAALLASTCVTSPAAAALPRADRTLYNVTASTEHGVTTDCGLSFIAGWSDGERRTFAAVGTVSLAATRSGRLESTLTLRTNLNKARRTISFAWMDVDGIGDTKGFTAPTADQTGPFFSFSLTPDPQGPKRLLEAARKGFTLGLKIIGLSRAAQARLPAAPRQTVSRLKECTAALNQGRRR